ncbi:hypothetical protein BN1708_018264 [Verticillium longisporum]|uniref:Uncharacterized protein n=1 Tax=Verticillium longisporum TaxID=100787 RepID=A0A0G4LXI3_VERLO|nr:hypothetical protein BN1708_018264 [Verticillium longisporum]
MGHLPRPPRRPP